jgi:hypothetical protein
MYICSSKENNLQDLDVPSAHLLLSSYILKTVILFSTYKWIFPNETKIMAKSEACCYTMFAKSTA